MNHHKVTSFRSISNLTYLLIIVLIRTYLYLSSFYLLQVIAEGTNEVAENTSSQIMLSVSFGPATLFTDLFQRHYRHAFTTSGKVQDMDLSTTQDFYSEEHDERDFEERCTARDLTNLGFKRLMGW